jgi:hypothetical protein
MIISQHCFLNELLISIYATNLFASQKKSINFVLFLFCSKAHLGVTEGKITTLGFLGHHPTPQVKFMVDFLKQLVGFLKQSTKNHNSGLVL